MEITKIALNKEQLYAIAMAVDIALDMFYEDEGIEDGHEEANQDTKIQLEGLQAIIGEKINSLNS